ncbi:ubiquitin carboxyl-terminal hydrolase [Histoplasma capsulatum G186AR]|uniref:Ubiquitin carboxyl-terminal hydrolase n=1 Tax=Ajellomyces capsulatus TaxID=5037 RepID=A0A8H8CXP3_AJECA|nr:ubiquitin carboxyl-terminal hydrolase [Histoplasma capsulatum]QSS75020.1 ubiquitin carboxyl-terminal hydrolase [Histoplasma capsulatum G186AR]
MACIHIDSPELRAPRVNQPVYREDCTQCFDSIDDPSGLDVCLFCFNGGCTGDRNHSSIHHQRSGHPLVLNIRRTRKAVQRDEPPPKMSKLAITAESEEDRYDTTTRVNCHSCQVSDIEKSAGKLPAVVNGVLKAATFSRKEEVKAWEQEYKPCQHILSLVQDQSNQTTSKDLCKCSSCDLKENLWLCLECGNLGCGRSQFGGVGGNSHGLAHADFSSHGVAVKLGSITPEGSADVFCYKCNDEIIDPDLTTHLKHWNINIADLEKTEQSLVEMQIEQNLKWDFSMTGQDGHESKPLFGKGLTGLKNLGNSCYVSSVLQCLFSLPEFKERYSQSMAIPPATLTPAEDLETQLRKLNDGLLSGRYSFPDPDAAISTDSLDVVYQKGLAPAMFKHLVGRGHEEFSTMRQQDSFEFLIHLFKLITRSKHTDGLQDPVGSFRFALEQRLQCLACRKVRYTVDEQDNISVPVPARHIKSNQNDTTSTGDQTSPNTPEFERVTLKECLDIFTADERVELSCTACGSKAGFLKRSRFKTFPRNLVINARRFSLVNWVPTKLNIPVEVDDKPFDMSAYISAGLQDGEELLPEDSPASQPAAFIPNHNALDQLLAMGFPEVRSKKALHATGNANVEAAMNWLITHMEDPDIDEPVELTAGNPPSNDQPMDDPDSIAQLNEMGIDVAKARMALRETGGDVMRAVEWVFSHPDDTGALEDSSGDMPSGNTREPPGFKELPAEFQLQSIICHKGASVHAGHYVAFVRKLLPGSETPQWVLFNDEKVVEASDVEEMKQFAYVYFFRML